MAAPAGASAVTFATPVDYPAGNEPVSVAIGDLNGDGHADLAAANMFSNNVSVLLGDGTGSFGTATNFSVGTAPSSVAIGDLNGDGHPDLAVANKNSNNVSVLLGTGSGSFGAATNFSVGNGPGSVAIGDLNGDGQPDLAVANEFSGSVSVLLGNGSGSFGAATNFLVFGGGPISVAIGDLNGDGRPDLAVANNGSDNVSVLLGDGMGSFGTATNFGAGTGPQSVAIGDLDVDGHPDLAVANFGPAGGSGSVSVLLGNGSGSFGAATNFDAGPSPKSVAIGNLNGDPPPDLAVANLAVLSVLINTAPATADASPGTLSFGSAGAPVPQGTLSAPQSVTFTNNGSASLSVSGFSFGGANPGDFTTGTDSCRLAIAPGSSCTVQVRFAPQAQGSRSATFTILSNAGRAGSVVLSGSAGPLPQGPPGNTGSAGTPGAQGPQGAQGPAGPPGAAATVLPASAARDAKASCRVTKRRGHPEAGCKVSLESVSEGLLRWKLVHGGRVYQHGLAIVNGGRAMIQLQGLSRLPAGQYRLRIPGAADKPRFRLP